MTLLQWSENEPARQKLHDLLNEDVMREALDTVRDLNLPTNTIPVPKGMSAAEAAIFRMGQLAGIHQTIKFIRRLPNYKHRQSKAPIGQDEMFWGDYAAQQQFENS